MTDSQLQEIRTTRASAIEGPYFVSMDEARDCPDHADSGLAMIDTGRDNDWYVARLCEWPTAKFLAASWQAVGDLLDEVDSLRASNAEKDKLIYVPKICEDDEMITYANQCSRLLRERNEAYDQCTELHAEVDSLRTQPQEARAAGVGRERLNMSKSLQELGIEIREINAANGWSVTQPEEFVDKYKFPAVLMLIVSEAAEALEAFRESDVEHFKEELADVLIRVLDCAVAVDDDFDATVRAKLEVNRGRGFHHGGKKRI